MGIKPDKKKLLILFHDFKCEGCKKKFKEEEMEIHKINTKFGYEDHRNLKVVCTKCHNIYSSALRIAIGKQR